MSDTSLNTTVEWNDINWRKVERCVFKVQKQIYKAVKSGQLAKARKLQKLLSKSYYAKLLAVRRVTQDNTGKKTAGIDGVKVLTPQKRISLVKSLNIKRYKAKALRRVWIPKADGSQRGLGIPTIQDRAMQALIRLGIEPYWEAQFEETSYGFRPARSAHDAIERIYNCINLGSKYVLDADIAKCFDKIDHQYLLSKLDCPRQIKEIIKQWLKGGVMDSGIFEETETGTPQGGVISPLLANIALDGIIRDVINQFPKSKIMEDGKRIYRYQPRIIRYADDFVVIHERLEVILECKQLINQWLAKAGLTLKPEKTRVCHTLNNIEIEGETVKAGFDFLGFNIRQYPVGQYRTGTKSNGEELGFQTIIKPSDKAIKRHHEAIKEQIEKFKNSSQAAMIRALNPIIRGWSNYYATVCSKEIFKREDYELWRMLRAAISRKTGKASFNKLRKYFSDGKYGKWTFQTEEGYLQYHSETPIKRHTLVKGERSPFDGDWVYWSNRKGSYTGTPTRVSKLIKMQKGRCKHCGQYFKPDDLVEIDHVIPRNKGGKDEYKNLQLLHRHCHDEKTRLDMESIPS